MGSIHKGTECSKKCALNKGIYRNHLNLSFFFGYHAFLGFFVHYHLKVNKITLLFSNDVLNEPELTVKTLLESANM